MRSFLWLFYLSPLLASASPAVQEIITPKGIRIWLYEEHTASIVSIGAAFKKAGSVSDPKGEEGRSEFFAAVALDGAGKLSGRDICNQLEGIGSTIEFHCSKDVLRFDVLYVKEHQQRTLDFARLILMEPTLAAESVKRVQQRLIAEEALTQDNPQILCERTMYKTAYPGHPYARYPTSVSLKAITKKALRAFQAQRLAKDQLIVVIGGDITAQEAVTCVDQVFGTLPEKAASLEVPFVAPQRAPKDVHIQKFMPQSLVFWYQAGISPSDPDFFPLLIANRILSGGLQSRLYKKLRMEEGLIYFVNTLLGHYAYAEQFFGVTRTESLNKVIEIIRQEWRTMVDKGVTEEELTAATKYLNGSFVLSFTDYRSIVSLLRDYALWGFSPDIIATRADKIQAVTCAAINNAIKQHFTPEALTFVSIGP